MERYSDIFIGAVAVMQAKVVLIMVGKAGIAGATTTL
jgi:hypothetical protein